MSTLCKSGRHSHLDEESAKVCCNGYKRALRRDSEPPLPGELAVGHVHLSDWEFFGYVSVWIPESKEP